MEIEENKWHEIKYDQDENEMATLIYTSGSTGMPKGSIITYKLLNDPFDHIFPFYFSQHFLENFRKNIRGDQGNFSRFQGIFSRFSGRGVCTV